MLRLHRAGLRVHSDVNTAQHISHPSITKRSRLQDSEAKEKREKAVPERDEERVHRVEVEWNED